MSERKITKIFIANRGEVAKRIAISAKKIGIETCAISHVKPYPTYLYNLIDDIIYIENLNTQIFLNSDFLIQLALKHNCDSIHPGFGFLAENPNFARKCIEHDLIWIGPNPNAIALMADKHISKTIAQKLNIPHIPSTDKFNPQELNHAQWQKIYDFCNKHKFPFIIKSALGGGGKGMKILLDSNNIEKACLQTSLESFATCRDYNIIIEKYLINPRHIEVQLIADKHKNIYAISDRECSIQRRYQKIIEEAPATCLSNMLRDTIYDYAINIANEINYDSIGTIEFLIDTNNISNKVYFLEMNTRLQVEHTITEQILNIDLVETQIKIAQNKPINKPFWPKSTNTHSIQARIYAEDPINDFLPSCGNIYNFTPYQTHNIRWDEGISSIDYVSSNFDPMIAKCIATSSSRTQAINLLKLALERTILLGIKTNIPYLCSILEDRNFIQNNINTQFITNNHSNIVKRYLSKFKTLEPEVITIFNYLRSYHFNTNHHPKNIQDIILKVFSKDNKNNTPNEHQNKDNIIITNQYNTIQTKTNTKVITGYGYKFSNINNKYKRFDYAVIYNNLNTQYILNIDTINFEQNNQYADNKFLTRSNTSTNKSQKQIISHIPGKIVAINITKHQNINEGDVIFVIESMKMQFEIKAEKSGIVNNINVSYNDLITPGTVLAEWEENELTS